MMPFSTKQKKHIMKIVGQEIETWERDSGFWKRTVENMTCEMEKEFGLLDDECCDAEEAIECIEHTFKDREVLGYNIGELWEKLQNGFQSFQHGCITIFHDRQDMFARILAASVNQLTKFMHREAYLRHLLKEVAKECFSEESILKSIKESMFVPIERKINSQCEKLIMCRIKACTILNDCIVQDTRPASEITQEISGIREETLCLEAKLNNYEKEARDIHL
ncbi:hypothetical protein DPMN_040777 [Dreissena polymorpha]|uniref:Uncharacterized protein n=1 Tax=Dreissena polymorpha TaxID=45954 RepID=A0A9D4CVP0_DREPO|nr:hypothetical protein DPMN_040777 [Dreissena polymorpha]